MSEENPMTGNKSGIILAILGVVISFQVPYHLFITGPFKSLAGTINNLTDLKNIYLDEAKANATIGLFELLIWIILPTLLIWIILISWRKRKFIQMSFIALSFGVLFFAVNWGHNQLDLKQYEKSSRFQRAERLFMDGQYPSVMGYKFKDTDETSEKVSSLTFETTEYIETISSFYLTKGFVVDYVSEDGKNKTLRKEEGYNHGNDKYAYMSISNQVSGKNKVHISKVEFEFH